MGIETLLIAAGAAATVAGTVNNIKQTNKANKLADKQATLSNRRSQIQAIREAQLKRASVMASGATQGGLDSSPLAGGTSGLASQLGSGLGYSSQVSSLSKDINKAQSAASTWQGIAQLGASAYGYGKEMKQNKEP